MSKVISVHAVNLRLLDAIPAAGVTHLHDEVAR